MLDSIQNNNFQKSIMAGICVSLGCICYLSINDKLIGSLLFSIGLFSIFTYDLNLYTGKIGNWENPDVPSILHIMQQNICSHNIL